MAFTKATKLQAKLRLALIGPSGSGKTYTALLLGQNLADRVAVIDTEHGSASKYADEFGFDVLELTNFDPRNYVAAIHEAQKAGYDALVIDSLSHAWMGKDGALELVDKAAKRSQSGNSFVAWREVTPLHNELVEAMLAADMHVIVTMRTKTEYVIETDEKTGKKVPKKIGLQPVQRDGLEYEFDVVADMDHQNNLIVSKTRCKALNGAVIAKPGKDFAATLKGWLSDGTAQQPKTPLVSSTIQTEGGRHPGEHRDSHGEKVLQSKGKSKASPKQGAQAVLAPAEGSTESTDALDDKPEETPFTLFIKAFYAWCDKHGDEEGYKILGEFGFETPQQIMDAPTQQKIAAKFKQRAAELANIHQEAQVQ